MKKATAPVLFLAAVVCGSLAFTACAGLPSGPRPQAAAEAGGGRAQALVQGAMSGSGPEATGATGGAPGPAPSGGTSGGALGGGAPAGAVPAPPQAGTAAMAAEDRAAQAFLRDLPGYLSRLTYMVYWNEASGPDPQIAKMASAQAARWLKEKSGQEGASLTVIDADQIEKNRADQSAAYLSATGQPQGMVQYLAGKFKANVYLELDFTVGSATTGTGYSATTQGSLKMLDVSTAAVLGAVPFQNSGFSPYSERDAATNVVVASVWNAMPRVYEQARQIVADSARRGIRYELTIQASSDARKMLALEKHLEARVRGLEELSFSPAETRLYLFSFQSRQAVRQLVLDAAAQAGMPDFDLVMARDDSFTFNTGL